MKNFRDLLNEELKDLEFKKEWDALEPEYQLIRQQLDKEIAERRAQGMNKIEQSEPGEFAVAL